MGMKSACATIPEDAVPEPARQPFLPTAFRSFDGNQIKGIGAVVTDGDVMDNNGGAFLVELFAHDVHIDCVSGNHSGTENLTGCAQSVSRKNEPTATGRRANHYTSR
ncbi:hypothetical protein [Pseudoduganella violaceinigra]|uniref:hypothetical protein n=1 Tax=Pseudoduganella violaceinigra TaxID=246602 RepID=UPI0012B56616|nr:hypothetical protein [Pseudoduganella violaceinigra]